MATIITITGGLPQLGKSQLALNLALELVRRGRWTGLFYEQAATPSLEQLVRLPPMVFHERRASDDLPVDVLRRGYQGLDIIGCRIPLSGWTSMDRLRLQRCIGLLDTREGYDDLLIDTSGMPAHEAMACSLAAGVVVMVVTAEPASQAQAFAQLRVLLLNGFRGVLRLLVNRVPCAVDAGDVQLAFNRQVHEHLGVDIPLLGFMPEDRHVALAQQAGQAFTSVFPESDAAARIVVLADAIEDLEQAEVRPQEVSEYWSRVRDLLAKPVLLPGGVELDEVTVAVRSPAAG
jgi:flagellar biosynthesis protein FlhG